MSEVNPFSEFSNDQAGQLFAVNTCAVSGANTLIAAPAAGVRICIVGGQFQNESTVSTTLVLKHGTTSIYRIHMNAEAVGSLPPAPLFWRLPAATALIAELSGANTVGYAIWYFLEQA